MILLRLHLWLIHFFMTCHGSSWYRRPTLRTLHTEPPHLVKGGLGKVQRHQILTQQNATVRYQEPGICDTTDGVRSFSGYVDLGEEAHTFFWFFEARNNPGTAPVTLWLNGGPGSDSLIGLFEGHSSSFHLSSI